VDWQLDPKLRGILVCPECRGELRDVPRGLLCLQDSLVFLVIDGVPMMLRELAKPATVEEIQQSHGG